MTITAADDEGHMGTAQTQFIVERARKHALDETVVRKQVDRLGNTEFSLESLLLTCDDNVMVPMSEINEARRLAVEALTKARLEDFCPPRKKVQWSDRNLSQPVNHSLRRHAELSVHVDTLDKAKAALSGGADVLIVGGDSFYPASFDAERPLKPLAAGSGKRERSGISARAVLFPKDSFPTMIRSLPRWQALSPDGIVVSNNGLVEKVLAQGLPLWVDWNQNTFNSQSILFWQELGAEGITLSPELTLSQVEGLARKSNLPLECLAEGSLEMMVSEYCVEGSFLGHLDQGHCDYHCKEAGFLEDRKKVRFPLKQDQFGRMHILNGQRLSMLAHAKKMEKIGLARLRFDARNASVEETGVLTAMYRAFLTGVTLVEENEPGTTRGHYFRGVL